MSQYKHWSIDVDTQHLAWLGFNRQDSSVNTINNDVLDELNGILQDLSHNAVISGLVIYSMKESGFIAGADVHEFAGFKTTREVNDFLRKGQAVFARLESLKCATVAMIDGFCMGGGLELALACDYRVATERSRIGLPEVLLGIHPGWGGTVRLPKLIGGFSALSEVIFTGSPLDAKRAQRLGIIDDTVPKRQLKSAAKYFVHNRPTQRKLNILHSLSHAAWIRGLLAKVLRHMVAKRVNPAHYPAPFAVIDLWEKEGGFDERAYLKEADSVEKLITTSDTARNLIHVFGLKERLKNFSKQTSSEVFAVHVIGAGVMGGDIAAWCALRGLRVTLQDQSAERIAPAIARAYVLFSKKLRQPRLIQAAMDRLIPDIQGDGIRHADVIIEAVFEQLDVKQTIVKHIETYAKPNAIIATNTSSIPLQEIRQVMQDPQRLVGIHFFNPVSKMELVEVVSDAETSQDSVNRACSFVGQIGRLALPAQSSPGFLVNRILMPYLLEAMKLLEEGYAPEVIDAAACDFGMLMGPIELADTVGLDICLAVAKNLIERLKTGKIPHKLEIMVTEGRLGRKSKDGGFYQYNRKGMLIKKKITPGQEYPELAKRLIDSMLHEAEICLREGVVADATLIDAGMIFGSGFAPFRGGLMHYANTISHQQDQKTADDVNKVMPPK
jgi:3-hydroxyacyl-CoA dehydrogenase/enoyl-CoA hydratase/3-hydroxybutyryl-CoA epimerase